jgi:hypothetical protein
MTASRRFAGGALVCADAACPAMAATAAPKVSVRIVRMLHIRSISSLLAVAIQILPLLS